jgi:hypothetical protein
VSSILKQLSDDDLEAIRHMIRRDAVGDLEIFAEAEKRLPRKSTKDTKTEKAKQGIVERYRKSAEYRRWLTNWENRDVDLRKTLELQKQRFELLSNLVQDPAAGGMDAISKSLQARLLTLAAEATDEELVEGAAKNGWIKNVIRVIQDQEKIERRTQAEELKAKLEDMAKGKGAGKNVDMKAVCDKVDEIMGLK